MNTEPITFAPRVGRPATPPLGAALLACLLLAGAAPAAPADALCGMESRAALEQARDEAAKSARWLDKQHADNDKLWHDSNAFVAYRQGKLDDCRHIGRFANIDKSREKLQCGSEWEPKLMKWSDKRDGAQARTEMYYTSWYVQADKRNAMDYCLAGKQPRVKYCGYKSEAALAKRAGQLRALLKETNEGIERKKKNIDRYKHLAIDSNGVVQICEKARSLYEIRKVWELSGLTQGCAKSRACSVEDIAGLCISDATANKQRGLDKAKYIGWELAGFKERVTYIEPELARLYACGAPRG